MVKRIYIKARRAGYKLRQTPSYKRAKMSFRRGLTRVRKQV